MQRCSVEMLQNSLEIIKSRLPINCERFPVETSKSSSFEHAGVVADMEAARLFELVRIASHTNSLPSKFENFKLKFIGTISRNLSELINTTERLLF